jgi:hypothetical protein
MMINLFEAGYKSSVKFISKNNDVNPETSCYMPFSAILKFREMLIS